MGVRRGGKKGGGVRGKGNLRRLWVAGFPHGHIANFISLAFILGSAATTSCSGRGMDRRETVQAPSGLETRGLGTHAGVSLFGLLPTWCGS